MALDLLRGNGEEPSDIFPTQFPGLVGLLFYQSENYKPRKKTQINPHKCFLCPANRYHWVMLTRTYLSHHFRLLSLSVLYFHFISIPRSSSASFRPLALRLLAGRRCSAASISVFPLGSDSAHPVSHPVYGHSILLRFPEGVRRKAPGS